MGVADVLALMIWLGGTLYVMAAEKPGSWPAFMAWAWPLTVGAWLAKLVREMPNDR